MGAFGHLVLQTLGVGLAVGELLLQGGELMLESGLL
jgi:hypothetical protein